MFLLLSPYIPNVIGEYRDNVILAKCDERIQQYRMGPVFIQLQNQTTSLPISGWNVSFQHVRHEFIFGCNCYNLDDYNETGYNESYRESFKQLFNLAVLRFYWGEYEPEEGNFSAAAEHTNTTRDWCLQNNITCKGHPLAWSREGINPSWLPWDNDTLMIETLENRVTTTVSKFQGEIDYWDVVNEPIHTIPFGQLISIYCSNHLRKMLYITPFF